MDLRALYAVAIAAAAAVLAGGWAAYERSGRTGADRRAAALAAALESREGELRQLRQSEAADRDGADGLRRQTESAAARAARLESDLAAAGDAGRRLEVQVADAARRQLELEAEAARLRQALAEGQAALEVARQRGLDAGRTAKGQYDKDLAALLGRLKEQEDAAAAAQAEGQRLTRELKASAAQVELLQKQIQDARAEERKDKADLRRLLDHVAALTEEGRALAERNAELERQNRRLDDRNNSLERKIRDLERTIDKLKD